MREAKSQPSKWKILFNFLGEKSMDAFLQSQWLTYILFVVGFVFLIKGADLLVDGAAGLARRFGVSELVIGLTIVAFGTSAPELVVNLAASLQGNSDIAIGNIIGSNIANILLILGIAAVIYPITVQKSTVWKEIPLVALAALTVIISVNDHLLDGYETDIMGRADGLIHIAFFIIFLYYSVDMALSSKENPAGDDQEEHRPLSVLKGSVYIIIGLAGLSVGADWIVNGAVLIAGHLGLSQSLIGLTVVAVGTSLPEMAASTMAALRKKSDIAIGNVVGSNIFNVFWILGISSVIHPIPFDQSWNPDLYTNLGVSVLLFMLMFLGKKHMLTRTEGVLFLVLYTAYTAFVVYRG